MWLGVGSEECIVICDITPAAMARVAVPQQLAPIQLHKGHTWPPQLLQHRLEDAILYVELQEMRLHVLDHLLGGQRPSSALSEVRSKTDSR